MTRQLTAIIEREDDGYVALCPELDNASQGQTVAEARAILKEALDLLFETASANELQKRLRSEVSVTQRKSRLSRLRVLSGHETCRTLATQGFREVRRRGSHSIMQRVQQASTISAPVPDQTELRTETLLHIVKQTRLPRALSE